MNRRIVHAVAGILIAAASMSFGEAAQVRVLIIDGESAGPYHRWQVTTPVLKKILDETQLFQVEIVTVGAAGLNYDAPDERWPPALKREFERYVEDGGGVVVVHAADNAFPGWKAYNE